MADKKNKKISDSRIQRFVKCNGRIREATLESEREFLKLAGNISAAQLQIVLAVGNHTPCSMSQLANILHFSKANITQMVDRLIQKKFLKKTRRRDDQRVVEVALLARGQKVVDLNREHVERVAKSWFSKMSDEQQEMMLTMLEGFLDDA